MLTADHTFIIPAFGDSEFLEDCILSLKSQTLSSKILLTTSTPSSYLSKIAARHGIPVLINSNPGGLAADWNFAFSSCTTKYLTLAHQDDTYLPDYTRICLHNAEKSKNLDSLILFTDYYELKNSKINRLSMVLFFKKLLLLIFLFSRSINKPELKKLLLVFGNPIACPSVMFNVKNVSNFSFTNEYAYNLDWQAWFHLAKMEGKFIYISKKLMCHRIHSNSQTSIQIENSTRLTEDEEILKSVWKKNIGGIIFFFYRFGSRLNTPKSGR